MTHKSPFEQFLGLVDTALDAVTEVVAANIDAPAGKREVDPVARAMKGVSLIFGDFIPPAPKGATKPSPKTEPGDTWAAATDAVTSQDAPPARAQHATGARVDPDGTFIPRTPARLTELENLRTFCVKAATMLSAGVSPTTALFLIASDIADNSPKFAEDIAAIGYGMRQGRPMADMMGETDSFPPMLVELVRVGEIGGHLGQMFGKAADYFRDEIDYLNGHPRQPAAGEPR